MKKKKKRKEKIQLTIEEKNVIYVKKDLALMPGNKNYDKFRAHFHYTGKHRGATHNTFNLRYKILKEISILFHNGSRCDFHFIIKKLVKELEKTQKKYITFPVPTKKVLQNCKSVKHNIKFIDSFRIMSRSL